MLLCIGLFWFGFTSVALHGVIVVFWFCLVCVLAVSLARLGCARVVYWLCVGCVSVVSRLLFSCVLIVPWLYLGCVLAMFWLCLGCVLAVSSLCAVASIKDIPGHRKTLIGVALG